MTLAHRVYVQQPILLARRGDLRRRRSLRQTLGPTRRVRTSSPKSRRPRPQRVKRPRQAIARLAPPVAAPSNGTAVAPPRTRQSLRRAPQTSQKGQRRLASQLRRCRSSASQERQCVGPVRSLRDRYSQRRRPLRWMSKRREPGRQVDGWGVRQSSNGEVEGPGTHARWRQGRTISQRPRRQPRSASRPPPTIVRRTGEHQSPWNLR